MLQVVEKRAYSKTFLKLAQQSLAPKTRRNYQNEIRKARRRGLNVDALTDSGIAEYLCILYDKGLTHASAGLAVAAFRWHAKETGQSFSDIATRQILSGFSRDEAAQSRRVGQADPITWDMCNEVCTALDEKGKKGRLIAIRDSMAFSICRDGLLRSSEAVALRVSDITFYKDGRGSMKIRRSKTDQTGRGDVRELESDTVKRIKYWLEVTGIRNGSLIRRFHLNQYVPKVVSRKGLSHQRVRELVQSRFKHYGGRLTSHSFRIGSAVERHLRGDETRSIMQAGGWRKEETMMHYLQPATRILLSRKVS